MKDYIKDKTTPEEKMLVIEHKEKMNAPIPPKDFDLNTPENKLAFGPLPKCEHGHIKYICEVCNITLKR